MAADGLLRDIGEFAQETVGVSDLSDMSDRIIGIGVLAGIFALSVYMAPRF